MSKYIDLIGVINTAVRGQSGSVVQFGSTSDLDRREVLAWLDAHRDQVPGRAITESELSQKLANVPPYADNAVWLRAVLNALGITVVPDPEPTNVEKLQRLQREWVAAHPVSGGMGLIEYLDMRGVKAGGDDEH